METVLAISNAYMNLRTVAYEEVSKMLVIKGKLRFKPSELAIAEVEATLKDIVWHEEELRNATKP